jgi:hypothetical protein
VRIVNGESKDFCGSKPVVYYDPQVDALNDAGHRR